MTNEKYPEIRYLMNKKTKNSNDYLAAEKRLNGLLRGYELEHSVVALPDFTDSNSLPIGTTVIIPSRFPINPSLVGMDIGCGYNFFSLAINPKRFMKKGKLKIKNIEEAVKSIDAEKNSLKLENGLGTIGSGNHFIDIFLLDSIYDEEKCESVGLHRESVYSIIHSGSRTIGNRVYQDFLKRFNECGKSPTKIHEFNQKYIHAFNIAGDFAAENRRVLRNVVERALFSDSRLFYDKSHNDIEIQPSGNFKIKKGASSLEFGEMFVIPSTCTDFAYVVVGGDGLKESYNTINHGLGRKYSRGQMSSKFSRKESEKFFGNDVVFNLPYERLMESAPIMYKNTENVMSSVEEFKLGGKIARLKPIGVIVEIK